MSISVMEGMKKRSSTRGYTKEPLTEAELDAILQAGLQAPTATNRQEIHFTVLKGEDPLLQEIEEEKNRLRGLSGLEHNFYYEAPVVVILSGEKGFRWSTMEGGIEVQNISLSA